MQGHSVESAFNKNGIQKKIAVDNKIAPAVQLRFIKQITEKQNRKMGQVRSAEM
jgi:hypothetical protein